MTLDIKRIRQRLQAAELGSLFIEDLGWDRHSGKLPIALDGTEYVLEAIAEKRGVQVFRCQFDSPESLPDFRTRQKLEKQIRKSAREHLVVYMDEGGRRQIWKPVDFPAHEFFPAHQSGDALIQKLSSIRVTLDEEESLDLLGVTHRLKDAFDRDRITRRFYDRFKAEHAAFLEFTKGIKEQADREWYASLMLNRLMFVYFIQKKGFLDGDRDYLRNRLAAVQERKGKNKFHTFYQYFLLALFHEGFSKRPGERKLDKELTAMLGTVPYLNGGLFDVHELEIKYPKIDIPDDAFEQIFAFFDQYEWHLDTRPLRDDREINPDVLGYIFEKYINQKQMGAYYTKEDITEYISKSTIIPFLFDAARKKCAVAFQPESALWRLLRDDPDRYLYPAVKKGVISDEGEVIPLPPEIAAGLEDVSQRDSWNQAAASKFALPTETWREHVARRQRCLDLRARLAAGEIHEINDLITWNLDIRKFAADAIAASEGPEFLRAVWQALHDVTVLDPTCGSGAFLFAALGVLEPLYTACLDRMQVFVEEQGFLHPGKPNKKFVDFRKILTEVDRHPSRDYFILKSIIVRNLYGVDIMEEAVEICKLRLFLKLVSQVERVDQLEPLPDIDFNVRAGNTLVGFATLEDVQRTFKKRLGFDKEELDRIIEEAEIVERAFARFHEMQTEQGMSASDFAEAKAELRERLDLLTDELDRFLAGEYGVNPDKPRLYEQWRKSHEPFHWFAEFYGIMHRGGFDVIIGNPPYVEISKIKGEYSVARYLTSQCGNLFAPIYERCFAIRHRLGRVGLIMPLSLVCTDRMSKARTLLTQGLTWVPCFDIRPASLFEVVAQRLAVVIQSSSPGESRLFAGGYRRWAAQEREHLFALTQFVHVTGDDFSDNFFKLSSPLEREILSRLSGKALKTRTNERSEPFFVHRICRYFIKALDFVPYFKGADGRRGKSEDYKPFHFEEALRSEMICFLNSSLFYWHWRMTGDGFHCGYGDVYKAKYRSVEDDTINRRLAELRSNLMDTFQKNSVRKEIRTKKGTITYQEFSPGPTKTVLDLIDSAFGEHFGFTPEELDFIINYDIKYRMGQDAAGDDDE